MPSIKKRLADAIINAVQGRRQEVSLTQTWLEINKEFSIGTRQGNTLKLSLDDHMQLRMLMTKTAGFDPLIDTPNFDSRMQAAATVIDEKWGGGGGASRLAAVYRQGQPIPTLRGNVTAPPGSALWIEANSLVLSPNLPLVVVENLPAFLNVESFNLPIAWKGALFIYRGHDEITSGVVELLSRATEDTPVAVMSDYDPAGLRIALSTARATGWLGPALDAKLGASNSDLYEKQAAYLKGLLDDSSGGLRPVVIRLMQEKIAFTQERMATAQTPLAYYSFQ